MNIKDQILRKSNLWHLGAILLFVTISCIYFAPALEGYTLKQGDIKRFVGMSREVDDFREYDGEQIQWTNSMFSGMPTTQISRKYENTWLATAVTKLVRLGLPAPIFFMFVYLLSFYILALSLKIKPLLGIIGSLAFGFSSYFIVILEAGHNSKAAAIGLAPLMIAGFIMAYRFKNWILGVALASIFMMVELAANHIQITYYMSFILILFGLIELLRHIKEKELPKFFKVTGFLVVGYVLAVAVNYGNLFGTIDYAKQTIRGGTELTINADGTSNESITTEGGLDRDYVTNWSYGHAETFTLFIPNYKGGESQYIGGNPDNKAILKEIGQPYGEQIASSNQYWGDQPGTSGPVYVGIIVMFIAFLGLVYVRDKYKWALLSVTLLAIMLSWGKNYVSAFVLLPILLYNVNLFLDNKKQLIFSGANTLLLIFAMTAGEGIVASSLTDFFLDYFPGYDKLRAVTIILVVAELCIPLLGILFLQRLIQAREEIKANALGFYIVTGVFMLFLFILMASPETFNTFLGAQDMSQLAQIDALQDKPTQDFYYGMFAELERARMMIFAQDVTRSFGFFILAAGLIFAFIRLGFSKLILGAGLAIFILLDLFLVDKRYVNNEMSGRKNYKQWVEVYEMKYPFTAGDGEKQILMNELQNDPSIQPKIDSALTALDGRLKAEGKVSAREKQLRRDYLTFRVLNRNTNFRVYEEGNPYNSSYTSYFNKSVGGYHGAKLSRYKDLIDFHLSKGNPAVVNMLNVKYFLRPIAPAGEITNSSLSQINRNALGNAWFVQELQFEEGPNEEILAMNSYSATVLKNKGLGQVLVNGQPVNEVPLKGDEFITILLDGMTAPMPVIDIPYTAVAEGSLALIIEDSTGQQQWIYDKAPDTLFKKVFSITAAGTGGWNPEKTAITDQKFADNFSVKQFSGQGKIEMTSYHPDRITYKSSTSDLQLAVFSEIYYEGGWKAFIDEQEVPVSRVNYVLRALEVPAGEHEIRFEFSSPTYEKAGSIALIATLIILAILIFGLYIEFKRSGNEVKAEIDGNGAAE